MPSPALWTKDFTLNSFIAFMINISYYMVMIVITDYTAETLGVSLTEAGMTCGIFILGALTARIFIGGSIERIGLKRSLYMGLFIFLASTAANLWIHTIIPLFAVRFIQGIGYGIATTATGVIMARIVPAVRRGEGTSYYAMFVTIGTAIGPFAGIYFYHDNSIDENLLCSIVLTIAAFIAAYLLTVPKMQYSPEKKKSLFSWQNYLERTAIPMACITFLISLGYAGVLGFITSFEKEANLLESGKYYFLVYAVVTIISRPFTGRWLDSRGDNFVMYPAFLFFAASLFLLSQATSPIFLIASAVALGLGFGTYMSCSQAIIINLSPRNRVGLATATFYIFMDLSIGFGPLLLGTLIPFLHFRGIYEALALLLLICAGLYYIVHGRKAVKKVSSI